jgi:hypothetical protein
MVTDRRRSARRLLCISAGHYEGGQREEDGRCACSADVNELVVAGQHPT